jgi:hypothetical protein
MEDKITVILQYKENICEFKTLKTNTFNILKTYSEDVFNTKNLSIYYYEFNMSDFLNEPIYSIFKCNNKVRLTCVNDSPIVCKCSKYISSYCRTCNEELCSDCCMSHESHQICNSKHISKFYNLIQSNINEINSKVKDNWFEKQNFVDRRDILFRKIHKIYEIIDKCNVFKEFIGNLDVQRFVKLLDKKVSNRYEMSLDKLVNIDRNTNYLNKCLNQVNKNKLLILKMNEIQEKMEKSIDDIIDFINSMISHQCNVKKDIVFKMKKNENLSKNKIKKLNILKFNGRSSSMYNKNGEENISKQSNAVSTGLKIIKPELPKIISSMSNQNKRQSFPLKNLEIIEKTSSSADKNFKRRSHDDKTKVDARLIDQEIQTYEDRNKLMLSLGEISKEEQSEDYEAYESNYEHKLSIDIMNPNALPILQKLKVIRPSKIKKSIKNKQSRMGTVNSIMSEDIN